jgi:ribose 5-phosphate isomerase B
MKIYIASDHGGYQLKEQLKSYLSEKGYEVEDIGNTNYDPDDDYPDFIIPLAEKVTKELGEGNEVLGIILGRSGNGEAIAANKVKGIRAAVCLNEEMARKAREDNDANILSLGADYINEDQAKAIVDIFINTQFSNKERYARRAEKIINYENNF